jgi:hypothetical protein
MSLIIIVLFGSKGLSGFICYRKNTVFITLRTAPDFTTLHLYSKGSFHDSGKESGSTETDIFTGSPERF